MIEIIEIKNRLSNGVTIPYVVWCSDGKSYVVKFPGNPQGKRTLVNEYVSSRICQILELPIMDFQLINVKKENYIASMKNDIQFLDGLNIQYYYILVNKKTSLKFFEVEHPNNNNKAFDNDFYNNPESGLLVCDNIIKGNEFEFYIQPQKVTQGTATPTNYSVLYGNMNCPKIIPKLTFDLCFIYSNWRGPVRIPAPLKYAEKLAKVKFGLNDKIKNNLSYI